MLLRPIFPPLVIAIILLLSSAAAVFGIAKAGWNGSRKAGAIARVLLISLIAFVMGIRPMVPNGKARSDALNVDCLFVVDTTLSMWANDYGYAAATKDTRISGARSICSHMVTEMTGASFAIITFGSTGNVLAPFTQDTRTIDDALDVMLPPSESSATGTAMSAPLEKMEQLLKSSDERTDRKTIVVFISDGETTDDSELASYEHLAQYVDGGLVIGLGTKEGATMTTGHGWSKNTVRDPETGGDAISSLDEESLKQIASDLGIKYIHGEKPGDVDETILRLRDDAQEILSEREELTLYDDVYWLGAFPLLGLLGWELYQIIMKRRV